MDVLVHTCGWIEWLVDGELADRFADALGNPARLIVPTVVQFELYKWTRRERDESTALEVVAATEQATIVPLDSSIALLAADLALEHRLSFADAVVYGTARTLDACVHTRDDRFAPLPGVRYFSRRQP